MYPVRIRININVYFVQIVKYFETCVANIYAGSSTSVFPSLNTIICVHCAKIKASMIITCRKDCIALLFGKSKITLGQAEQKALKKI